ncbi:helix-turn-helix domain-containing protein [Filimonas effusa]|uniref:AraC family transcriptional regulator n=1 Tax=Filimonas effusa TaxID=2508721 RepID=A0A4Q1DBU1_9BACT|nr:AraC family transcriptional regulator [Filimonas effusa]RXK86790.1 AraC family transcriptional regulator [Filimonas effusa]
MTSTQLFRDVEVSVKDLASNNSGLHKHHYFELIYVLEGTGIHNINNNHYQFAEGDVFLLTPEDAHTFHVSSFTRFCIVDFTKGFFTKKANRQEEKMDVSDFFKRLEYIFHNHHNVAGSIIADDDRPIFRSLIRQLIEENTKKQAFEEIITQNIVFLLLHFIARHIQQRNIQFHKTQNARSTIHEITAYIQQHIYDKELLKVENLAAQFNKSPDHLSRYFKSETGNTIKDYITRYKLNLIETRLKYSDLTIAEIADEMNFTDESHLNKTFKNVFGKTARQYKMDCLR